MVWPIFPAPQGLRALALALALTQVTCAAAPGRTPQLAQSERTTSPSAAVSDEGFAAAVHDFLLSAAPSPERSARLAAIEARQMAKASVRFKSRSSERGLAAVTGALYFAHAGDSVDGLRSPAAVEALEAASRELALRGDEGRSAATYDLLLQVLPPAQRPPVAEHLRAIEDWMRDATAGQGPVAAAGTEERIAIRRWLLEPSPVALADAARITMDWIQRAVALRDDFRRTRVQPPREEGTEAWRAMDAGPVVLASLYLRNGDFNGARAALDRGPSRELLMSEHPQFAAVLDAFTQERTGARCGDLLGQLRALTARDASRGDDDLEDDRDLFGAAAFVVAGECYRLDPTVPQVALALGVALGELGMAEVTGAVLLEAVRAHPDAALGSEALALSLASMAGEEDAGDPDAARRTFDAVQPVVAVLGQKALAGKVHPSAARLRAAMGEIELREGRIDRARTLLSESVEEEAAGGVLLSLSRIDWRDGHLQVALDHLRAALSSEDASRDPALRGEILLTTSDVARDTGDVTGARAPLAQALRELMAARNVKSGDLRARVERVLARVLDRFGALQPAQRALDRAYAAAPGDKHQAAQTIEILIGRAFVRGDVAMARDGLQRALAADLDADDLVYFALWVRLLERQLHATTDDSADRVFASTPEDPRWVATLARFGEGKLRGDDLVLRAATPIQHYEALFYAAMDHRASGDKKGGDDLLRQVVAGTGVELSEVVLARDMLDPAHAQLSGLPPDVVVP
jgi:tetratricopeptide (TPR) repeat protein